MHTCASVVALGEGGCTHISRSSKWMEFRCIIVGNCDLNDFVGSAHREETMCRIWGKNFCSSLNQCVDDSWKPTCTLRQFFWFSPLYI
jgi:hypothetical protein